MANFIQKHHLGSSANLRFCYVCLNQFGKITLTEIRCDNMRLVPILQKGQQNYIRCTNGVCKEHDTSLTVMGKEIEHCCARCFFDEMMRAGMLQEREVPKVFR